MRLIFVRHAEPDYEHNTLTEKGFREAELLVNRTRSWNVNEIYCSPLGRALNTAAPTLAALDKEPIVCDWLQEFSYPIDAKLHPFHVGLAWDFSPEYLGTHPELFDPNHWKENEIMKSGNIGEIYDDVCRQFDEILAKHGYIRQNGYYVTEHTVASDAYMRYDGHTIDYMENDTASYTEDNVVFFCHLGVLLTLASHLMNTTPAALTHGFFTAPSSITIFTAEERIPGQAYFRCQVCGDTSHLKDAQEPISFYGAFAAPFQG